MEKANTSFQSRTGSGGGSSQFPRTKEEGGLGDRWHGRTGSKCSKATVVLSQDFRLIRPGPRHTLDRLMMA